MKIAVDVGYNENQVGKPVAITFQNWEDANYEKAYYDFVFGLADYVPGEFYKRELPCIEKLFSKVDFDRAEVVVIDGYVFLDDDYTPGLGAHLFKRLNEKVPVIGVAKSPYQNLESTVRTITRGGSSQPLYITSIGVELDSAAANILKMHGAHRIPTLLRKVDQLSKR